MAIKLGDLFVQIGADPKEFIKELKGIGKPLGVMGKEFKKVGIELTKSLTVPIAGFGALALKNSTIASAAFTDFHRDISKTFGRIGDELFMALDLEGTLQGLGDAFGKVADVISELPAPVKSFTAGLLAMAVNIGPLIFGLGQMLVATRAVGQALFLFARTPIGLLLSGLVLAGTALFAFSAASRTASATQRDLSSSVLTTDEKLKKAKDSLDRWSSREAKSDEARLIAKNDEIDALRKLIALNERRTRTPETKDVLKEQREDLQILIREQEDLARKVGASSKAQAEQNVVTLEARKAEEDFLIVQSHVNTEMDLGATALEVAEKRLDAYKKLYEEWTKLLPASDEALQKITQDMRAQAVEVDRLKAVTEDQKERSQNLKQAWDSYSKSIEHASNMERLGIRSKTALHDELTRDIDLYNALIESQQVGTGEAETLAARITELSSPIGELAIHLQETMLTTGKFLIDVTDQISQGIGNALAQVIVYGADIGEAFAALGKQILASIISTLVSAAIQWVIFTVLGLTQLAALSVAQISTQASIAAAAAVAWAIVLGGPIGAAVATGVAAAAAGAVVAAAGIGRSIGAGGGAATAAAEHGGIFSQPQFISVSENPRVGPEIVLNQKNVDDFFGDRRGGRGETIHVHVNIDGREAAEAVIPHFGKVLRRHGVRA